MISDLMDALRNARHLDGKVRICSDVDDMTLAALYRGARFTIFPSLYEGWGLPVTESLGYGKVCIASSSTSIPEAGGDYCLYHDPDNVTEAYELYRKAITEPEIIRALERKIAAEYRPTEWRECAAALLAAVAAADASPPKAGRRRRVRWSPGAGMALRRTTSAATKIGREPRLPGRAVAPTDVARAPS